MTTTLDAVVRLTAALSDLTRALETGQPDQVLAAEPPLASAARALVAARRGEVAEGAEVRQGLIEARLALWRCQVLGRSVDGLMAAMWRSHAPYGPTGSQRASAAPRPTIDSRT